MKYLSKMMLALFFAVSLFLIPGTNQALYFPPTCTITTKSFSYTPYGAWNLCHKTSVVVEYYNPPYYKLAANVLTYNAEKGYLAGTRTQHYSYNIETGASTAVTTAPYTTVPPIPWPNNAP